MTTGPLTNPPLIITDVPTCLEYTTGDLPDLRYLLGRFGGTFVALDTTPDGFAFPGHARGVIGIVELGGGLHNGPFGWGGGFVAVIHKPTHVIGDYAKDWIVLPDTLNTFRGGDANNSYTAIAGLASQRKGDYCYVFMQSWNSPLFVDTTNPVTMHKVNRAEFAERGPISGGATTGQGYAMGNSSLQVDADLFVSDDEQPFIWNVYGQVNATYDSAASVARSSAGDADPIVVTGFRDDGGHTTGWEIRTSSYITEARYATTLYGQTGAYYQLYDLPSGQFGIGPFLVFPWTGGDYSPPELWFFLLDFDANDMTTGRLNIYRSRWTKGAYVAPRYRITHNSTFTVVNPELNPNGYAFDHNWFTPANHVATIGPFSGATITNPKNTPLTNQQNWAMDPATTLPAALGITVQRDKSKPGVLHMVVQSPIGKFPKSGQPSGVNAIWYLNSVDDGATWSTPKQATPAAIPDTGGTLNANGTVASGIPTRQGFQKAVTLNVAARTPNVCLVRTNEDMMLLGGVAVFIDYSFPNGAQLPAHQMPADAGARIGLMAIDYTGRGFGDGNQDAVVFRSARAQTSWQ